MTCSSCWETNDFASLGCHMEKLICVPKNLTYCTFIKSSMRTSQVPAHLWGALGPPITVVVSDLSMVALKECRGGLHPVIFTGLIASLATHDFHAPSQSTPGPATRILLLVCTEEPPRFPPISSTSRYLQLSLTFYIAAWIVGAYRSPHIALLASTAVWFFRQARPS